MAILDFHHAPKERLGIALWRVGLVLACLVFWASIAVALKLALH